MYTLFSGILHCPHLIPCLLPLALTYLFTCALAELLTKAHWCDISQESGGGGREGVCDFNKFLRALGLVFRASGVISQCC